MAASLEQIKAVLKHARYPHPAAGAASIFAHLHQPHLQADAVITRAKSRLMLALVSQLLPLIEQIAQYDQDRQDLDRQDLDFERMFVCY